MKPILWSILGKVLVIIAVLAFVLCLVLVTKNEDHLWLLFLLMCAEMIPTYSLKTHKENEEDESD